MARFKIVTRKNCEFCKKLKEWLAANKVDYEEIDYHDEALNAIIEKDEDFSTRFCDMSVCVDSTSIIIKDDEK